MTYNIIYKHAYNTTREHWHGPLGEAQAKAVEYVMTGGADYIEIRDTSGKLVDSYPATITPWAIAVRTVY